MKERANGRVGEWARLASLLLIGCLALGIIAANAHRFTDGRGGVPLDDAWIHFQFARNLARGDGLSFNPGEPTSGSTAPLWTLLLTAVYLAGGDFPLAGQLLSGVCFLAMLAATYVLGKRLTSDRWAAWLAGIVVAVNGRIVWAGLSALETCLFATLSLLAINAHLDDRGADRYRLRTAVLFGLAALSRPEGYLLFALAMADFGVQVCRSRDFDIARIQRGMETSATLPQVGERRLPLASCILPLALPVGLFAVIVLPYLIFSLRTSGHLLPNTYHAKTVVALSFDLDFVSVAARYLILDNPLLLPFYVLGIGALFRRATLLCLWSVGLPLVYAFLVDYTMLYQHGRYLMPLIPCNAVVGIAGLLEAQRLARRRGWRLIEIRFLSLCLQKNLVSVLIIAGTAWRMPTMANLYAWNVNNINQMHVALGRWAAENTSPGAVLALNDIGAITYFSERPVVDLAGLITPEVVPILHSPNRDALLADFMAERGVAYAIILPDWFPDLAARADVLKEVHRVTLERNTIVGGETMVVYQTHW